MMPPAASSNVHQDRHITRTRNVAIASKSGSSGSTQVLYICVRNSTVSFATGEITLPVTQGHLKCHYSSHQSIKVFYNHTAWTHGTYWLQFAYRWTGNYMDIAI